MQLLRNGKRRVTKKSLEELFPCDKEFLFEFSQEHPEVLKHYKDSLPVKDSPISDEEIGQVYLKEFGRLPGSMTINHMTINTGDQIVKNIVHGDNIGGVVGSGTVNARDISVYKDHVEGSQTLDQEAKRLLLEARSGLDGLNLPVADKHDVADNLGKLTAEIESHAKEGGLIKRYYERVKEVAPTVASILASIKDVAEFIQAIS
ncbi:hypothetical protein TA3x_000561 [Tundrisphaera sp. TA3]|uniref:hypothetical protein n=1 Tax=Tundrisphaera sp. TA3 TaxID=3435775 RepID=UPI003EBBF2A4